MAKKKSENWIQDMHMKKGALREKLGTPKGKKIPVVKIEKAEHAKSPTLRKEASLAMTFRKMKKKSK
jgi:hypothetical protein